MRALVLASLLCCSVLAPGVLVAQGGAPGDFEAQRTALQREVQDAEQRLAELRAERLRLQARVDNALVLAMQARARELMMSSEQEALRELDALLATAQSDMLAQRDRMLALGDAVRRRAGAVLVVLVAVDSAQFARLGGAEIMINDVTVARRSYGELSAEAFRFGAVDQAYRADVLPTVQRVRVRVMADGEPVEHVLDVPVAEQAITYVRFTARGPRLDSETWMTRADARP